MFKLFKKKETTWLSPVQGKIIPMEEVPDDVFSSKMMGDGFAFIPEDNKVYSPLSGEVMLVFKTKHALVIKDPAGYEVIVHIGIGTVELKGEGFDIHVEVGDQIDAGTLLATVDFDFIQSKEKSIISPVIITNMEVVKSFEVTYGDTKEKTEICKILGQ